ncbi:phosphatidylglycerol lysyltransferase domain-containing protein [Bacillus sp. B1-b2]|uniref:phosphatidylglycerol lysyltransferase domain-containing protein n=1 Tax=Bacillus sp. B1-b2 TaxID=2653201 RepID=UPI00186A28AE|nr:phosphatidylglycerol lysyltransferase domain-containing protein [Bacillus sp. B1-b2]
MLLKQRIKKEVVDNKIDTSYDELLTFLQEKGGNHVTHLIFLKDKELFWTRDQNVLIVYKQVFNKYVVLGDPIGEEQHIKEAIKEFSEFCLEKKVKPVFYQVHPRHMQCYHDSGFRFAKLGEEAVVKLSDYSMEGKKNANLRNRMNKFSKSGYEFSIMKPPHSNKLLTEIKEISNSWLGKEKEKGFSVVSFKEDYVSRFPVAIFRDPEGNILAFATLATDYKETITIDLMRKIKDCPHGTMDVLFANIFIWAKENGYQYSSLGMAPLANVGTCEHAFISEKMIRLVYLYGNKKYNFKGLRDFKSKFATNWEPKYLAYKKSNLPIIFIQLILLINKKQFKLKPVSKKKEISELLGESLRFD